MAAKLNIVSQYAMDLYYQNYKTPTDFFSLEDFQFHIGAAATSFYDQLYRLEYARMKSEGETGEVVSFSNDFLSSQILKVQKDENEYFSNLIFDVLSFTYDQSNVGIQNVFVTIPRPSYELERSDIDEFWQFAYLPQTNRIFWALDGERIRYRTVGKCNIQEVRVVYVPSIDGTDGEVEMPDGIVDNVINSCLQKMRAMAGRPVKMSLDGNMNETIQTEMNPKAIVNP